MPSDAVAVPDDHGRSVDIVLPAIVPLTDGAAGPIGREWHDSGGGDGGSATYLRLRRLLI